MEVLRQTHQGYFLWGPVRTGKTHLIACTGNQALDRGIPTLMVSTPRLWQILSAASIEEREAYRVQLYKIDYLILDDLGQDRTANERGHESWHEFLFTLADERHRRHVNGSAVTSITTNLKPGDIAGSYSHAIASRLIGMTNEAMLGK
jgi:DNA replication protein DnaC